MASKSSRVQILRNKPNAAMKSPIDFEKIAERAPGMIDVYHYPTGTYVYVNKALEYLTGYTTEDLLNGGLDFFTTKIHPDDIEGSLVRYELTSKAFAKRSPDIDDSKPFTVVEYRFRRKDGRWVWLHTEARVFSRDENGDLEYIVNSCIDITEQKEFETKLRKIARELRRSQQALRAEHDQLIALNVAKDEFVSIASHQLRMPATGVKQYIGLLLQGYAGELTDAQQTILQTAYDSNERQLDIITDLLNTSHLDAGKVQPHKNSVNLIGLIDQVIAELQEKTESRRQRIKFTHGKQVIDIFVDERLILMVIENLVDNASKYSPEGKAIEVTLSPHKTDVEITIKDHGFGIPKTDQKKLFQKFSRIENPKTENIAGTGLGLYWAKKIVDLHDGTIELQKSSDKGSVFAVTLPLA